MRAIQITTFGGPEVLELVELPDPVADAGQQLVEVSTAGVNFADTHATEDSYLAPQQLPLIPGAEVVGRLGDGRRVLAAVSGGYAERALAHPLSTYDLPDGVDDAAALAMLVQGTTAWHLLRTCAHLVPGESVVVHAAAGGVGTLAVQLAKAWGAGRVIATASTPDKRALALELGADVAIDGAPEGLTERLIEANQGRQVDVVFEMAGGAVFDASYKALAPFGRIVAYGISSTQPNQVSTGSLLRHSRAVVGFYLFDCLSRPAMFTDALAELFARAARGTLRAVVGRTYPLQEAAQAHIDLGARRSTGKLLLDPSA